MKKLISMTDFVLREVKNWHANSPTIIINYANFLKQPLELWMFVPCDDNGNVFEEPDQNNTKYDVYISNDEVDCDYRLYDEDCLEYQKSKERCLFDGFEIAEYNYLPDDKSISMAEILHVFWHNKITGWKLSSGIYTVEDLVKYNLKLTPTAIKKIGL